MNIEEYKKIYGELDSYEDIKKLSKKYDEELLLVIFTEKHVRAVKTQYYKVTKKSRHLLNKWKEGHSFYDLAKEHTFSPIMMTKIILKEKGMTKKEVNNCLKDHKVAKDERIKKEVKQAVEKDMVYSEKGAQIQKQRGEDGEELIRRWLRARKIGFKEEADLKGKTEHGKTVDFLLDKPIVLDFEDGPKKIHWIESKGSFGDTKKIKRDFTKQLEPYTEIWGPGMVVYWFDFLDGMELWLRARDVEVVEKEWFLSPSRKFKYAK